MCKNSGEIRQSDVLWADAKYDSNLHPLMMYDRKPDQVIGSMAVYIEL